MPGTNLNTSYLQFKTSLNRFCLIGGFEIFVIKLLIFEEGEKLRRYCQEGGKVRRYCQEGEKVRRYCQGGEKVRREGGEILSGRREGEERR